VPDTPVEDAVRANCDALMMGDLTRIMTDLTPEALGALMASGANMAMMPILLGYEIESQAVSGEDHVVRVAFTTPDRVITAIETWREIDGAWKITNIAVEGL
jgi:hypothetical protein